MLLSFVWLSAYLLLIGESRAVINRFTVSRKCLGMEIT